jgi:hypothetical protein
MSEVFSPQSWQLLSEYLDGQLSATDRQKVEQMLRSSNTWKLNYQALVETRALLQYAPKRKAPRSFLLTQTQADKLRRPSRSFFSFRFASVLSTGLAVAVFLFGFFARSATTALPAMQAPQTQEKASQSDTAPANPIIIWGPPGTIPDGYGKSMQSGSGGGSGIGGGAPMGMGGGGGDGGIQSFSAAAPTESSEISPEAAAELTTELAPETTIEGAPDTSREMAPEPTPEGLTEAAPEVSSDVATEAAPAALGAMLVTETPVEPVPAPEMTIEQPTEPTPELAPVPAQSTPAPTAIPSPTQIPATANNLTEPPTDSQMNDSGPILGVQPDEAVAAAEPVEEPLREIPAQSNKTPYWYASGILLAVGILTGLAALISSRKKQS